MPRILRDDENPEEIIESEELDEEKIKALSDETRRRIMKILAEEPGYPLQVARELELEKQKVYYHFQKLEDADLIEKAREEKVSGGSATFYRATAPSYLVDFGAEGEKFFSANMDERVKKFLKPLLESGKLDGKIVVGSPEQHGPDKVRARDGHLSGEVALKLGNYGKKNSRIMELDTEVFRDSSFNQNMIMIGGVLTNTVTKKFNSEFPARFEGENFPYREIKTPESSYSEDNIGIISKTQNPENSEKSIFMIAGVRNSGTEAAVLAFKNLEEILDNYRTGEFYRVVRGLDLDGDGDIDDFEVVE